MFKKQFAAMGLGFILLLCSNPSEAQNMSDFKKVWSTSYDELTSYGTPHSASDWLYRIRKTADGNYTAVGYTTEKTYSDGNEVRTPSMVKIDQDGKILVSTRFLVSGDNNSLGGEFWDFVEVNVSGGGHEYVAAGNKAIERTGCTTKLQRNPFIVRTDDEGNEISHYYPSFLDYADYVVGGIIQVAGSSGTDKFLVVGQRYLYSPFTCDYDGSNAMVIELEYNQSTHQFSVPFGGYHFYDAESRFYGITPIVESGSVTGYALCGKQQVSGGNDGVFITRINTSLAKVWDSRIDYTSTTSLATLLYDYSTSTSTPSTFAHTRVTTQDNKCTEFGNEDRAEEIIQLPNGNLVVSGIMRNVIGSTSDANPWNNADCFDGPNDAHFWAEADGFVTEISKSDGSISWFRDLGHFAGIDYLARMRVNSTGIYVSGTTSTPLSSPSTTHPTTPDILITKLQLNGTIIDTKRFEASSGASNCGFDLELDNSGKTIICAGNNRQNKDDYLFIKLSACQTTASDFDVIPNANTGIGAGAYTLSTSQEFAGTWDIYNNVTINGGATIKFADDLQRNDYDNITEQSKIVVHPGGQLTITGGATLKAYDACLPGLWDGIEVLGSSSSSQTPPTNQGKVILDGGTIQDARIGIKSTDGGIIVTQSTSGLTTIKDCRIGAEIDAYVYGGSDNASSFSNTTFDCNHTLPYYPGEGVDTHVKLDGVVGVKFTRCKFKNTGYTSYNCTWGTGISATSSGLKTPDNFGDVVNGGCWDPQINGSGYSQASDATTFENLDYGIREINPSHSSIPVEIRLCQFSNVKQGINLEKVDGAKVMLNYFYYNNNLPALAGPGCSLPGTFYAIFLDHSDGFEVQDNKITTASSGITNMYNLNGLWIKETGTISSKVYWNQFLNNYASNGTSNGFNMYGLVVEDAVDDGFAKDIQVWDNEFKSNYYSFKLTDPQFLVAAPSGLYVTNTFTTPVSYKIYSTNAFTYRNLNINAITAPEVSIPVTVLNNTAGTAYSTGSTHNYCKGTGFFPTAPQFITEENRGEPAAGEFNLSVFPNPSTSTVTVGYSLPEGQEKATLVLTNSLGQRIEKIELSNGSGNRQMDFSHLKPGVYSCTLLSGGQRKTARLLIIK